MRMFLDTVCPRCGTKTSILGVSEEVARLVAEMHVCGDGVATVSGALTVRWVPGPGERLRLPEEKGQ